MNELRWLWRGKIKDDMFPEHNGEWIYGDLVRAKLKSHKTDHCISLIDRGIAYTVDTSTLGKCTGLHDKNKKLVFEGDIIEYENPVEKDVYKVVWDEEYARFALAADWFGETKIITDFLFYCSSKCSIIGNIHDNPELLTPNRT